MILNGESPKDLVMKVKEAKEKKEARALRREAKKVAAMLEKEEREKKAAMEVAEKEEKASTEEEDREEKKKEQIEEQRQKEVDDAVAAIAPDINQVRRRKLLQECFGTEEEEVRPLKKRVRVDLDSDSDSDFAASSPKASSPIRKIAPPPLEISPVKGENKIFFPREAAKRINPELEIRELKNKNRNMEKALEEARMEAALWKGKLENLEKIEGEEKMRRKEVEDMKKKVEDCDRERKVWATEKRIVEGRLRKEEREREEERVAMEQKIGELKKEKEEERLAMEEKIGELEAAGEEEKRRHREKMAEIDEWVKEMNGMMKEKEELCGRMKEKEVDRLTLHIEVKDGRAGRRSVQYDDGDETFVCYSSEHDNIHCVHVMVSGSDLYAKVRNVRWPSEGN